jgi:hypothetical protein
VADGAGTVPVGSGIGVVVGTTHAAGVLPQYSDNGPKVIGRLSVEMIIDLRLTMPEYFDQGKLYNFSVPSNVHPNWAVV